MGKMSDLIHGRPSTPPKDSVKPEVVVTKRVTEIVTETVKERPVVQASSPEGRSRSQSDSITATSRLNEKQELAHLNNHLAGYFDRVHRLENENRQLQVNVMRVEEQVRTEEQKAQAGLNFDQEVQRIRDTLGKDNEKLRVENQLLKPELDTMKNKIAELQQFSYDSAKARFAAESALGEMIAKLKGFEDEKNMWEREALAFQDANQKLGQNQKELEVLLAQERNARLNEERRLEALMKEFEQFKVEHDKILAARAQQYIEKLEVTRTELIGQHQVQLQDALIKLRQEMDVELAQSRIPIQEMYEKKLSGLTFELDTFRRNYNDTTSELRKLEGESAAWIQERGPLIEKINLLEQDNAKLQNELRSTLAKYVPLLQQAEADRNRLQRELKDLMQQYADLMDAKVQLHNEIAAYRNLLENEELHMSQLGQHMKVTKTTVTKQQRSVAAV